ncbi:MAG TPA: hypothetical protein VGR37_03790 [Longimicrobiaceae bacterium]|nr:hypothetical protein [Longimicrobiaceae bacterium]
MDRPVPGSRRPDAMFRRRRRIVSGAVAVVLLSACKPDSALGPDDSPLPDLSGTWAYTATEMRVEGISSSRCDIDGMTLTFGPWGIADEGFEGRAAGGVLRCDGDLAFLSGSLPDYPVRNGTIAWDPATRVVTPFVGFSISTRQWRHDGVLSNDTVRSVIRGDTLKRVVFGDTISGAVSMLNGGIPLRGRFRAVRRGR